MINRDVKFGMLLAWICSREEEVLSLRATSRTNVGSNSDESVTKKCIESSSPVAYERGLEFGRDDYMSGG